MQNGNKASKLVARLLSSEEITMVGGGDPPHTQTGTGGYDQNGSCPLGYVQTGGGSYTQRCTGTGPM